MRLTSIDVRKLPSRELSEYVRLREAAIDHLIAKSRLMEVRRLMTSIADLLPRHDPHTIYLVGLALADLGVDIIGQMNAQERHERN